MSRETLQHLNQKTLIGQTARRGSAWHYRADLQGAESNHYEGFIPVADVNRRLFDFTAEPRAVFVELPATFETMSHLDDEGRPVRLVKVPGRQAVTHSDSGDVFGIFSDGYATHQFSGWLLGSVSNILSDTLNITSAGLLKQGAVAWVEVSVPENVTTPHGITFRPNLLAVTSHDGSLATTFKRTTTNTVCDNTMGAALREKSQTVKIRHSRYSAARLAGAAAALDLIQESAADYAAELDELVAMTVTDKQWQAFLDEVAPIGKEAGRGQTIAINRQDSLRRLWNHDARVSPWANTAFGVVQAVNTWEHHEKTVKGTERAERNMLKTITGEFDALDAKTMTTLNKVLANV